MFFSSWQPENKIRQQNSYNHHCKKGDHVHSQTILCNEPVRKYSDGTRSVKKSGKKTNCGNTFMYAALSESEPLDLCNT
jgi:hypothetical protein